MQEPYFRQQNFIPQQTGIQWNTLGYSGMGLDVAGVFTSGSFILEGTNDGATWTTCKVSKNGTIVSGGIVSTTGHYTFLILGFNTVRLTPSALSATLTLTALGTVRVPNLEQ